MRYLHLESLRGVLLLKVLNLLADSFAHLERIGIGLLEYVEQDRLLTIDTSHLDGIFDPVYHLSDIL